MADISYILDLLKNLTPPDTLIHVGAGGGVGGLHAWRQWDVPDALVIDPDPQRLEAWFPAVSEGRPQWRSEAALLADEEETQRPFYRSTYPSEDGLVPTDRLKSIWPGLHERGRELRSTRRLDVVLNTPEYQAFQTAGSHWVIVDCLPALPVLRGAGDHLARWSVLCVRVILDPETLSEPGAGLKEIRSELGESGFRLLTVVESNHPAVGTAVFVKDWRVCLAPLLEERTQALAQTRRERDAARQSQAAREARIGELDQALAQARQALEQARGQVAEASQRLEGITAERDQAIQAREEAGAAVGQLESRLGALAQEKAALQKRIQELEAAAQAQAQALAQTRQERDAARQSQAAREARIGELDQALAQARQALEQARGQAAEANQRLEGMTAERDQANAQRNRLQAQVESLQKEKAVMKDRLDELAAKQAEADKALVETDQRQRLIDEEIIKAEAQIDLIKDILLREKAF